MGHPAGPSGHVQTSLLAVVKARARTRAPWVGLGVVVLICTALIMVLAWANAVNRHQSTRQLVSTAADDYARMTSRWFAERQADADGLAGNFLIRNELSRFLAEPESASRRREIADWMGSLARQREYSALILVDPESRVRLHVPDSPDSVADADVLRAARTALMSGQVQFVDMPPLDGGAGRVLSWAVPLGGASPVAALILTANPEHQLWPELNRWFDRISTAEAVLVRRDGDDIVFLNSLRLTPGAPGRLAVADRPLVPAVRASNGESGEVNGPDYRGVPVLAGMRQIPGTSWSLVIKIDQQEIDTAIRGESVQIALAVGAAGLVVLVLSLSMWLRRETTVARQVAALTQRDRASTDQVRTLTTAIEQTPLSVLIADLTGAMTYVNPTCTAVTGYAREELIGRNPRLFKSGTHPASFYRELWDTLLAGRTWTGELHNRRKNGELYWEAATISQMRDGQGQPSGYVAIKREITADKLAAAELEQVKAQLTQAQKMESIGRLAGGVAHDFNNMLAVILGHAEMALEGLGEADARRENLIEILQAGRRSSDLTRQLLAFARRQTIHPKVIDLNESVEDMLKMLRRLVGENLDLRWQPGNELWPVLIDPAQVNQILANLSVNARDAIAASGVVTITTTNVVVTADMVRTLSRSRVGQFVELTIADTGCGMTPEVLSHLFEPFFTTKAAGKGTGLGTATVYGIVAQNHGFIHVESAVGVGTSMRVFLPRTEPVVTEGPVDDTVQLPVGTETVLLVEDEPAMLDICRRMLMQLGYTVIACGSASQAQEAFTARTGHIDLLLTDVVMPGTSGRELAESIRTLDSSVKVLFMSGYTAEVLEGLGVVEGGPLCLTKPFSTAELAAKLREALA